MGKALEYISFLLNIIEEREKDQNMQNTTSAEFVDFLSGIYPTPPQIMTWFSRLPLKTIALEWRTARVVCYLSHG